MFAETTRETLTGIAGSTSNFSANLTECVIQVYSSFENTRPWNTSLEKDIFNLCFVSIYIYMFLSLYVYIYICIHVYIIFHFICTACTCIVIYIYIYINPMRYLRCCEHMYIYKYMSIYMYIEKHAPLKCEPLTDLTSSLIRWGSVVKQRDFAPFKYEPLWDLRWSAIEQDQEIRCVSIIKWLFLLKPRERIWQVLCVPRRTSLQFLQSAWYRFIQDLKTRALEVGTFRKRFSTSHCFRPYDFCLCMN